MPDIIIFSIVIAVVVSVILGVMAAIPGTRKYLRYAWILIPAAAVILLVIISRRKGKTTGTEGEALRDTITGVKEKLQEAQMVSAIEVSAAKQKNKDKIDELKKVTKIKDSKERRRRLIDLGE
jgi:hypothetical protein